MCAPQWSTPAPRGRVSPAAERAHESKLTRVILVFCLCNVALLKGFIHLNVLESKLHDSDSLGMISVIILAHLLRLFVPWFTSAAWFPSQREANVLKQKEKKKKEMRIGCITLKWLEQIKSFFWKMETWAKYYTYYTIMGSEHCQNE